MLFFILDFSLLSRRFVSLYPTDNMDHHHEHDIATHKNIDWAAVDAKFAAFFETEWFKSRPQAIQDAYRKYPPWYFYTSTDGKAIRRIYGFCQVLESREQSVNEVRAHAITAMMLVNNNIVGGLPLEDCLQVQRYTDDQIAHLLLTPNPSLFLLPDGWMAFISNDE